MAVGVAISVEIMGKARSGDEGIDLCSGLGAASLEIDFHGGAVLEMHALVEVLR